jgi:hypothetical protein
LHIVPANDVMLQPWRRTLVEMDKSWHR